MTLFRRARIPVACLPASFARILDNHARRYEPWVECDLTIDGPTITSVTPSAPPPAPTPSAPGPAPSTQSTDLGGHLVFPGLIDVHTHLDKTHTWPRAPNPTGEFWDAIKVLHAESAHWTAADLRARAGFALRQAWAHGTTALRTHLDSSSGLGETSHAIMAELRTEWADRLTLQTVSLCNVADFSAGAAVRITRAASTYGASALGGFPQPNPDLPRQLDYLLAAARDLGLGLDLHVDESGLPHAECLRATAEAVLRNEFPYPVACGHCCSLAVQDPTRAASTIDLVKAAGITVISLPLCNLYLQHRGRHSSAPDSPRGVRATPFWRGLTLVHELIGAGVPVAAASDNVRDAFFAWGDYDALEVLHHSIRIGHLDTRLDHVSALVTTTAADAMSLPHHGRIAPGAHAALVVTSATTFNEFLARPAAPRRLLHGETFRDPTPPPYTDLPHR